MYFRKNSRRTVNHLKISMLVLILLALSLISVTQGGLSAEYERYTVGQYTWEVVASRKDKVFGDPDALKLHRYEMKCDFSANILASSSFRITNRYTDEFVGYITLVPYVYRGLHPGRWAGILVFYELFSSYQTEARFIIYGLDKTGYPESTIKIPDDLYAPDVPEECKAGFEDFINCMITIGSGDVNCSIGCAPLGALGGVPYFACLAKCHAIGCIFRYIADIIECL